MEAAIVLKAPNGDIIARGEMPKGKIKKFMMNRFFRSIKSPMAQRSDIPNVKVEKSERQITVKFTPINDETGASMTQKEVMANLGSKVVLSGILPASLGGVLSLPAVHYLVNLFESAELEAHKVHNAMTSLVIGAGVFLTGVLIGVLSHLPALMGYRLFKDALGLKNVKSEPISAD